MGTPQLLVRMPPKNFEALYARGLVMGCGVHSSCEDFCLQSNNKQASRTACLILALWMELTLFLTMQIRVPWLFRSKLSLTLKRAEKGKKGRKRRRQSSYIWSLLSGRVTTYSMAEDEEMQESSQRCKRRKFGEDVSADVLLTLVTPNGEKHGPIHLQSKVLRKSSFFDARLSERWTSNDEKPPFKLKLEDCASPALFVRCIELMHLKQDELPHAFFVDVGEALGIWEVAACLLCRDCESACMRYLEAVAWSSEEEDAIRARVSSFRLTPSPELADKLFRPNSSWVMKDVLLNLLSSLTGLPYAIAAASEFRVVVERALAHHVELGLTALALSRVLQDSLSVWTCHLMDPRNFQLHQFYLHHSCSNSSNWVGWILDQFDKFQITHVAIQLLSQQKDLVKLMFKNILEPKYFYPIANRLFGALQNENVPVPNAHKLSLVTTWMPVFVVSHTEVNTEWFRNVVESLPMTDQEAFFELGIESYGGLNILRDEPTIDSFTKGMGWLLDQFDTCQFYEIAIKHFSVTDSVIAKIPNCFPMICPIIYRLFSALQNGKVIVPSAVRVGLVTEWLHAFSYIHYCPSANGESLCNVVASLSMIDQKRIFNLWIAHYNHIRILDEPFQSWYTKLQKDKNCDFVTHTISGEDQDLPI